MSSSDEFTPNIKRTTSKAKPKPKSRKQKTAQACSIEYSESDNDVPITRVRCLESGEKQEAYGDHSDSKKRALATLTGKCSCNAKWHFVPSDDDSSVEAIQRRQIRQNLCSGEASDSDSDFERMMWVYKNHSD